MKKYFKFKNAIGKKKKKKKKKTHIFGLIVMMVSYPL